MDKNTAITERVNECIYLAVAFFSMLVITNVMPESLLKVYVTEMID